MRFQKAVGVEDAGYFSKMFKKIKPGISPKEFRKREQHEEKNRGLFFSIGIAGSLILGGCGKEEKEPVTITMIHAWGGTGEDHVAMRDIYDGFRRRIRTLRCS